MKSPNNKDLSRHFLPQNETCSARNELYLIKLLAKWKPSNTQTFGKPVSCSAQTDGENLLLMTTKTTQLSECGERELVSTLSLFTF